MSKKLKVVDASRSEGPLYTVMGEDELLYVFDSTVSVLADDGKVYAHNTFRVKGFHEASEAEDGEWNHRCPNRNYKSEVQAFIDRVTARGVIDLRFWSELQVESPAEREAYNLKCEADERAWGL